jgi:hypothetical protein
MTMTTTSWCMQWCRLSVILIVVCGAILFTIIYLPYRTITDGVLTSVSFTVSSFFSLLGSIFSFYAYSTRYLFIGVTAVGYDVSSTYCDPTAPLSGLAYQIWHAYGNTRVDRASPEYIAFCMANSFNKLGTFVWGHVFLGISVVGSIMFTDLTVNLVHNEYRLYFVNSYNSMPLSSLSQLCVSNVWFWVVYLACGFGNWLIRLHYYPSYSYSLSLFVTSVAILIAHRTTVLVFIACTPKLPMYSLSSTISTLSSVPSTSSTTSAVSDERDERNGTNVSESSSENDQNDNENDDTQPLVSVV